MGVFKYNWTRNSYKRLNLIWLSMIFCPLMFISTELKAQAREFPQAAPTKQKKERKKGFDPSNLRVGGGFGASFGNITYVELSPNIGYMFTERFIAGIGARYIYLEDRNFLPIYKTNIYGGSIYSQYMLIENIFAHVEGEVLNLDDRFVPDKRVDVTSIFVGGGYRSMIGDRSFGSILLLYNLNETEQSPYTNPLIRISFGIGI